MEHKPLTGSETKQWKGDEVGYSGVHHWLTREYGSPSQCEHCGKVGEKSGRAWTIQWANRTGSYKRDLGDWLKLCRDCHRKYDKENKTNMSNKIKNQAEQEIRVRTTKEQYAWVKKQAEIECEGNKAQFLRKLIEQAKWEPKVG